jgi:hypothetical protein
MGIARYIKVQGSPRAILGVSQLSMANTVPSMMAIARKAITSTVVPIWTMVRVSLDIKLVKYSIPISLRRCTAIPAPMKVNQMKI